MKKIVRVIRIMSGENCMGRLCPENGYFCRCMDAFGHCIATSCKRMTEIEDDALDRRAKEEEEKENGY